MEHESHGYTFIHYIYRNMSMLLEVTAYVLYLPILVVLKCLVMVLWELFNSKEYGFSCLYICVFVFSY